jgi:hypothetical protein
MVGLGLASNGGSAGQEDSSSPLDAARIDKRYSNFIFIYNFYAVISDSAAFGLVMIIFCELSRRIFKITKNVSVQHS